jgi:NAD-dependent DNA ligase
MNSGYNSVCRILKLNVADLLKVDGFQEKTANTLYNGIKEKVEQASLAKLMSASNVFGHGFAEKKFDLILKAYPNVLNETMEESLLKERLLSVPKVADKTANDFVKNIDNFKTFLKDCNLSYKLNQTTPTSHSKIQVEEVDTSHVLFEKKICVTGFRDKGLSELLQSKYLVEIQNGVNSKTFAVIVKSMDVDNNKVTKAKSLNIPIYTAESFKTTYIL